MVVGVGVIGLGEIWERRHRLALQSLYNLYEVKVVCDIVKDRAKKVAAEMKCDYTTNYQEVIERKDVNAVSLLTPPFVRLDPIRLVCEVGKPLYCEKPLALNVKEAKEIRRLVSRHRIPFITEFVRRHLFITKKLMALCKEELGDPIIIWCFGGPFDTYSLMGLPLEHWMHHKVFSGGWIMDFAVHLVDYVRFMFRKDATRVSGYTSRLINKRLPKDDIEILNIEFGRSKFAQIMGCHSIAIEREQLDKILKSMDALKAPRVPMLSMVTSNNAVAYTNFQELMWLHPPEEIKVYRHEKELSFWEMGAEIYKCFNEYIETDVLPFPAAGIEDAYAAVEIILAGEKSMEEGSKVNLPL